MKRHLITILVCIAITASTFGTETATADRRVAEMSDREKAELVVGGGWQQMFAAFGLYPAKKVAVAGAAGFTRPNSRLGIPSLILSDGPSGVRIASTRRGDTCSYYQTAFPAPILLASSFDTALVRQIGAAMGKEARRAGIDVMLAPGMNLLTYPLCGRSFEYYSSDPYLSGHIAAAMIRGIQQTGVGACAKHFAGNDREENRMRRSTDLDSVALHDRYLKNFRYALEADPWCVMSAYNALNGVPCRENAWLLDTLLRQEWGYEGVVMTDWWFRHHPVQQFNAGNDLLMPGSRMQVADIRRGLRRWKRHPESERAISPARIDSAVSRVVRMLEVGTGGALLEVGTGGALLEVGTGEALLETGTGEALLGLCRQAAAESMVLLKNTKEALPLAAPSGQTVALYGCSGYESIYCGTGSGFVATAHAVSSAEGLRAAGFTVLTELADLYGAYMSKRRNRKYHGGFGPISKYTGAPTFIEMKVDSSYIAQHAREAEVAIVSIGRQAGEAQDRSFGNDYLLSDTERRLLTHVSRAFREQGKPVIVVLNIVGPIETNSWKELADAIVLTWAPGQEGGHALADILTGKVNPSGRLPLDLSPYEETEFQLGHGLCYTSFEEEETADGLRVTNTGTTAGKHVILRFDADGGILFFQKTPLLAPGEQCTIDNAQCTMHDL